MNDTVSIRHWTSDDPAWVTGQAFYDHDDDETPGGKGNYCALVCLAGATEGPRGGAIPAEMVEILAPTWKAIRSTLRGMGITAPPLSEVHVKDR